MNQCYYDPIYDISYKKQFEKYKYLCKKYFWNINDSCCFEIRKRYVSKFNQKLYKCKFCCSSFRYCLNKQSQLAYEMTK